LQNAANRENYVSAMNPSAPAAFKVGLTGEIDMFRKVMTIMMIGGGLMVAACNTVRGAGEDVQSVANCTENAINNGQC
jgi:predicted small secreted protein